MEQMLIRALAEGSNAGLEKPLDMVGVDKRLWQCLGEGTKPLDRRSAVAHWLKQQAAQDAGFEIQVPIAGTGAGSWLTREQWLQSGIQCQQLGQSYLLLAGSPWKPDWLTDAQRPVFAATLAQAERRKFSWVPMDAGVSSLLGKGYNQYQAPGQREAVRAALLSEPGSTLLVNLPTGTGKTLVGQVMAMVAPRENALSVVIVPTVALALEQAERYRDEILKQGGAFDDVVAWHSGLDVEERRDVRSRIREGTQRVIVTSPEAVCSSLTPVLFDAAENGGLRNLIVDEAHLVIQWGTGFRPEFQQLGGLVRGLRTASEAQGVTPCTTILMTATLTEDTRQGLLETFGAKMAEIHACHLRPEPAYWCAKAESQEIKQQWVMEALAHAPRPLILYCTRPAEARQWHSLLQEAGYGRVGVFTGLTKTERRIELLDQWRENQLDIMVATSAFGVGMDKNDVRCVIHATVPENMDRYYQEVGRAGRDGLAATSILIYTNDDMKLADRIGGETVIGVDLGHERWCSMWQRAESLPGGYFRLNLANLVPRLHRLSKQNKSWNLRTILLMVRAGVIQLDAVRQQIPQQQESQSDVDYERVVQAEMKKYQDSLVVRPLVTNHTVPAFWRSNVEPIRKVIAESASSNLAALKNWLATPDEVSLCRTLTSLYTLSDAFADKACGGCPACRKRSVAVLGYVMPSAKLNREFAVESSALRWHELTGLTSTRCFIMYPRLDGSTKSQREWARATVQLIKALAQAGVICAIRIADNDFAPLQKAIARTGGVKPELLTRYSNQTTEPAAAPWPELLIPSSSEHESGYAFPRPLRPFNGPLQLALVPEDMVDRNHHARELYVKMDHSNWVRRDTLMQALAKR
ncbi:hypothetical protein OAG1_30490 [Agarivorans sp. OAG1]|nr:hypothetical protein OAG1_30490 [Agarivorans sp. OAG1]